VIFLKTSRAFVGSKKRKQLAETFFKAMFLFLAGRLHRTFSAACLIDSLNKWEPSDNYFVSQLTKNV
ncbi:hypothetical protein, partial [Klebsiella pneumoniae]|uniref:hypothetical protein n=1 Tax=Klebsiella pneumoniae TaxID=573 RepID=UPI0024DEB812